MRGSWKDHSLELAWLDLKKDVCRWLCSALHMTNLAFKRSPQNAYPKSPAATAFLLRGGMSYTLVLVWGVRNLMVFAVTGLTRREVASQVSQSMREMLLGDEGCSIHWAVACTLNLPEY